ncbi:CCC motif membrane protein [Psychroserpens ponticola]|uniref:CCC motif membrane protein n=1 Tax=Psychroserpens ponticola TaxID=2932268 RepID=A0ABY7S0U4_9FLAO|nr:CCC motif membrane protein [Psychroserpens ponticola]WCO03014.1 CCC motif membrane protein [Psychroserpens ponticola]
MENNQTQEQLQNSTLILVLGILSIVTCCCYGIVGLILGIVTIVLAKKATKIYAENPDLYTGFKNVKTGKILAIIGLILSVLYLLFTLWAVMTFGWEALQDQELMQERMREMFDQ